MVTLFEQGSDRRLGPKGQNQEPTKNQTGQHQEPSGTNQEPSGTIKDTIRNHQGHQQEPSGTHQEHQEHLQFFWEGSKFHTSFIFLNLKINSGICPIRRGGRESALTHWSH